MSDDTTHPFSIAWMTAGDEQLTVDGLRSLVRQLLGAPICLDAEGAPTIGRVTAAAQIDSATVQIDGVTQAPLPDGASVCLQYRLRRAAMSGGVLMVSALDTVSVLVTLGDGSGARSASDPASV